MFSLVRQGDHNPFPLVNGHQALMEAKEFVPELEAHYSNLPAAGVSRSRGIKEAWIECGVQGEGADLCAPCFCTY